MVSTAVRLRALSTQASSRMPPVPASYFYSASIIVLAGLFVIVRCWGLQMFCLDTDEIYSLLCAKLSLRWLVVSVASDVVHPPLSYTLLHHWIRIGGESLLWVRLLPFVLSVAALCPLFILFRQLGLTKWGKIIALSLIAFNDYQVFHARYVRMYALLFLLALASMVIFNCVLDSPKRQLWTALAGVNLLLVYTHYYGWMVIMVEGLCLAWLRRHLLRPFLIGASIICVAFTPWALAATRAAIAKGGLRPNLGWIRQPGVGDLLWYYAGCNGPLRPFVPACLILALSSFALFLFWRASSRTNTDSILGARLRFTVLMTVIPPALSFLVSNLMPQSVWGSRHLIISVVPYTVLLAMAITALSSLQLRSMLLCVFSVWAFWGAYRVAFEPEPSMNLECLVRQLVELNGRQPRGAPTRIYFLDPYLAFPTGFYLDRYKGGPWHLETVPGTEFVQGERCWVAYSHKSWKGNKRPQELLAQRGYQIGPGAWAADAGRSITVFLVTRSES